MPATTAPVEPSADKSDFENKTPHKKFVSPIAAEPILIYDYDDTVCVLIVLCAVALNNNSVLFLFFCARDAETESDGREETREIRTRHEHRQPVAHGGDSRCGAAIPGSEVVRRRRIETNHHQTAGRGECDDKRRRSNKPDDDNIICYH